MTDDAEARDKAYAEWRDAPGMFDRYIPSPAETWDAAWEASRRALEAVTDEKADRANQAWHEFVWGPEEPLSRRDLGITRQAWKYALKAALETGSSERG